MARSAGSAASRTQDAPDVPYPRYAPLWLVWTLTVGLTLSVALNMAFGAGLLTWIDDGDLPGAIQAGAGGFVTTLVFAVAVVSLVVAWIRKR